MFKPKHPYSSEELAQLVTDLHTLTKLRDKAIQDDRLYKHTGIDYQAEIAQYTRNIQSAQKLYTKMLDKNVGKDT